MKPFFVINFKTYPQATGKKAEKLISIVSGFAKKEPINFIVCPQFVDLYLAKKFAIPFFAQHVDPLEPGRNTGFITPYALKSTGVKGSLINHSEHRIKLDIIEKCVETLRRYKLKSLVCVESPREAKRIAKFNPDFIAIEPPELIGSGISISQAKPQLITKTVETVKKVEPRIKVLCGAGISNGEDVRKALELGAEGILVASGIAKVRNPSKVIKEFVEGMK
jgi:triosephosphate isomerase